MDIANWNNEIFFRKIDFYSVHNDMTPNNNEEEEENLPTACNRVPLNLLYRSGFLFVWLSWSIALNQNRIPNYFGTILFFFFESSMANFRI